MLPFTGCIPWGVPVRRPVKTAYNLFSVYHFGREYGRGKRKTRPDNRSRPDLS
ncbi:hypothetical protein CLOSYM_02060 [[Clostridium] symbiosum ATCC 14940]|uniref:Uncharacterized protein n=1 Tax=[Clostridium] symbiosum ATCC 14940 TaxID=411472 RepID=A0ABC9TYM6_CLOSY|nr:hypothetical protein CLOSYM_02060 [[Clostridium] symbiosum ATCC 14940]